MADSDSLGELQMRLSFQEEAIHQLELAQEQQRRELDGMRRLVRDLVEELKELRQQLEGGPVENPLADERPPHY